ncbi:SRPBCC domain-containing protein [Arthrobacter gandavensis]|uniref:SRPBCC domain-containing protein n=1 Tax=Arthrobacter gandavensis TaxID=169960 RepID=UPI00188E3CEE|nr:SRPBCC domain-containing protein [Arthrobacter gandavensis]MBF4992769.1 SRPBCC domain-containing protein [Arthrobacter gandavensis]
MAESPSPSTSSESRPVPEGRIQKVTDGWVLAFDKQLDYPTAHIWDVLTNPRKVEQWLGPVHPDWELGKEYTLGTGGSGVSGTVLQLNPRTSLQISWDDELGEESVLDWQVLGSNGGSLLKFRARSDTPDFLAEGSAGWQGIMDAFAAVAAGNPAPEQVPEEWEALCDAYSREFDVSPTMGKVVEKPDGRSIQFERWYNAPARDIGAAVEASSGNLGIGEEAVTEVRDDGGLAKLLVRQRVQGGTTEDTASLMAAWHLALDSAAIRLQGDTPHPNSHRLRALEALYRSAI